MTEKRFKMVKSEFTGKYVPVDNNKFYNFCGFEDKWDCINFVRALNDFSKRAITNGKIASKYLEENEQLNEDVRRRKENEKILIKTANDLNELVDKLEKENEQLKKDVDYWKQIASQYNNVLNVFEHCKKYKTECKDIHWSSD